MEGGRAPPNTQKRTGEVMLGSHRTTERLAPNPFFPFTLAVLLASPAALSQQAASSSEEGLEEVVVTSRLREERLMDVPVSVSVFTEQTIRDAGIRNPADFISLTPNVSVAETQDVGTVAVVVRGVGQIRNGETPVAVSVDGVLQSTPLAFNQSLFDVKQIEVLKGPQGALYGRNAIAGAINITTKRPTDQFEGTADLDYGNGNARRVLVSASGPLAGDRVVFRAALLDSRAGGWITNTFLDKKVDGFKDQTGVFRLDARLSDSLRLDARASHTETTGGATYFVVASNANRNGVVISNAHEVANDVIAPTSNNAGSNDRTMTDLSLKLDYDLAGGVLTSISAATKLSELVTYDGFDYSDNTYCIDFGTSPLYTPYSCANPRFTTGGSNGTPVFYSQPFNTTFQKYNIETYSQEVRYTSRADSPWRYIVGAYFLKRDRDLTTATQEDKGFGIIPVLDFDPASPNQTRSYFAEVNRDKTYALFGQINHDLTQKLELGLALRYDSDKRHQTDPRPDAYRVDGFGLLLTGPRTREKTFSELQPKVTLTYKPDATVSVYSSFATGFRSGGFNAPGTEINPFTGDPIAAPVYKKEISKNYEVGFKSELLDRSLSLSGALFYSDVDNLQAFNFNGAVNAQVVTNIDNVHIKGAELEAQYRVVRDLTLYGSVGYADAKIERYSANPAAVGNQVPYNTKIKLNVGTQWRHHFTGALSSLVRIDVERRGKTYFHEGGTPIGIPVRDPLTLLNSRVGLETDNGWQVTLWGRNLTDRKYYEEVVVPAYAFQARPRTYGLEVRKDF